MAKKPDGYKRPPGPDQNLNLKHILQYGLLLIFAGLIKLTPAAMLRFLGRGLGALFYHLDRRHRGIALKNLDQAFGDQLSEMEKRALVRRCFFHFGTALLETLHLYRLNEQNLRKYVSLENIEHFREGLAEGKGVILCSAHYGNWEVMNLVIGFLGLPMSVMARPIDNPLVHRYLERIRTRSGNRVIYKHKSIRKVLSSLKNNRIIGIVNDQDVHDHNRIMIRFCNRLAATTPVPAALSIKTGAPIITGYAIPRGKGRYLLKFGDLIWPDTGADRESETRRITELLNQRLEAQIQQYPDPWMWMHQRFKTGEAGRTDFYLKQRRLKKEV